MTFGHTGGDMRVQRGGLCGIAVMQHSQPVTLLNPALLRTAAACGQKEPQHSEG